MRSAASCPVVGPSSRQVSGRRARGSRSWRRVLWRTLGGAALVLAASGQASPGAPQDPAAGVRELADLERSNAILERQLDLARGRDFYLTLDPGGPALTLMLRGAELRRYRVLGVQVGHPRVAYVRRGAGLEWQGVIWSGGTLDPPRPLDRLEVQAEDSGREGEDPKPPAIPPTAEELYPVPARYHIRFEGGLSIEIRPQDADARVGRVARVEAWWSAAWRDAWTAMTAADSDVVRLRLVLDPEDAASLYRALPPSARLLVLDGAAPVTLPRAR